MVVDSYGVDTNWYADTEATNYITSELEKLSTSERYNGQEEVHTANGSVMMIKHVGHSTIQAPTRDLHLNNVLHVLSAKKNLLSVYHFTSDNNAVVEFHPIFFCGQGLGHEDTSSARQM